jgi:hypothetical protein
MTTYRATELHDNDLPWACWDQTDHSKTRPMEWGKTLIPTPIHADPADPESPILRYEWQAILPEGTPLPDWITAQAP